MRRLIKWMGRRVKKGQHSEVAWSTPTHTCESPNEIPCLIHQKKRTSLSSVAAIHLCHVKGIRVCYNIALSCLGLLSGTTAVKAGKFHVDEELGLHVKCGFLIMASFGAHYYIDC